MQSVQAKGRNLACENYNDEKPGGCYYRPPAITNSHGSRFCEAVGPILIAGGACVAGKRRRTADGFTMVAGERVCPWALYMRGIIS